MIDEEKLELSLGLPRKNEQNDIMYYKEVRQ